MVAGLSFAQLPVLAVPFYNHLFPAIAQVTLKLMLYIPNYVSFCHIFPKLTFKDTIHYIVLYLSSFILTLSSFDVNFFYNGSTSPFRAQASYSVP
jgi:hypothetical protein